MLHRTAEHLANRLLDTEEDVRMAALRCLGETAGEDPGALTEKIIVAACDRMKDKKAAVRQEAMEQLTRAYVNVLSRYGRGGDACALRLQCAVFIEGAIALRGDPHHSRLEVPLPEWDSETSELHAVYHHVGEALVSAFAFDNVPHR
jgi:hypothetical protein